MIDRFADWFAGVLLEKGVITEDELEVQVYGIQTILSNLLSYGVVLAVSWAFGVLLFAAWAAGCLALWCKAPCVMPDEEDTLELRRKLRLRTAVVCAVVLGAALLSMWLYSPALRRGAAAAVASVPVVALTMLAGIHAGRNEKE